MTEQEMRESKVPWPKTIEELTSYINSLVKQEHDYGTCVYAMSMAALATFYYVSHELGVTGFQASCADLDFLRRTRDYKMGFRVIDYKNLLYPQYLNKEHFPTVTDLISENKEKLIVEAEKLIQESPEAHPDVIAHWKRIASLKVPENTDKAQN